MAKKSGGTAFLVVLGLVALGSAGRGDGSSTEPAASDDYSYAAGEGASTGWGAGSGSGLPSCDDAVAVGSGIGAVVVPGDDAFLTSSRDLDCQVDAGSEAEAVVALQESLVRCHGQSIDVDGDLGPATGLAVENVQRQHGVAPDGTFGPATRAVMLWPAGDDVTCLAAPAS